MASIRVSGCDNPSVHCKEYMQIKLKAPLIRDSLYQLEYWVCPLINSPRVNKLGFALSEGPEIQGNIRGALNIDPMYEMEGVASSEAYEWVRVSSIFTADRPYTHLTIGVFALDSVLTIMAPANGPANRLCVLPGR